MMLGDPKLKLNKRNHYFEGKINEERRKGERTLLNGITGSN
jgi:hypothetical protein